MLQDSTATSAWSVTQTSITYSIDYLFKSNGNIKVIKASARYGYKKMCFALRQDKITNRHRIDVVCEIMAVDDAMLLHNTRRQNRRTGAYGKPFQHLIVSVSYVTSTCMLTLLVNKNKAIYFSLTSC